MKKKIILAFLGLVTIITGFWMINIAAVKTQVSNSELILKVVSDKREYILGEAINLQTEIKDKNNKTITLRTIPTVEDGYMHVWVASTDRIFKEYLGEGWGLSEGNKMLEKSNSFKSQTKILHNVITPKYSFSESRIETIYAIPETGVYFIKATATIFSEEFRSDGNKITIESEPIQIVVNEPSGEDAEVWKLVKNSGDFALFMHEGQFLAKGIEEREKLINEVERIAAKYPTSILANQMKRHIEEFRQLEEVIKENMRKRQNNEKP